MSISWFRDSIAAGTPLPVERYRQGLSDDGDSDASSRVSGSEISATRSPVHALAKSNGDRMVGVEATVSTTAAAAVTVASVLKAPPPPPAPPVAPAPVTATAKQENRQSLVVQPVSRLAQDAPTQPAPPAALVKKATSSLTDVRFACAGFEEAEVSDISARLSDSGAVLVSLSQNPAYTICPHGAPVVRVTAHANPRVHDNVVMFDGRD